MSNSKETDAGKRVERAFCVNETLEDITHYMRVEVPDAPGAHIPKRRVREILHEYADRIEAAAMRERDELRRDIGDAELTERLAMCARCDRAERPAGNAAAMREALVSVKALIDDEFDDPLTDAMQVTVDAALSDPPRNCDRFKTEKEARKAFYKVYFGPTESEYVDEAFINWLFAPAVEEYAGASGITNEEEAVCLETQAH